MSPEEKYKFDKLIQDIVVKFESANQALNLLLLEATDVIREQPVFLECPHEFRYLLYEGRDRTGKLAVRGYAGYIHSRHNFWAECLCGRWTRVRLDNLLAGRSQSCGKCGRVRNLKPKPRIQTSPPEVPALPENKIAESASTNCSLEASAKPIGFAALFAAKDEVDKKVLENEANKIES